MKLSEHFSREEFACQDGCGFDTVDVALLSVLERVRKHFNAPVTVTSGCRCSEHNKAVGGAQKTDSSPGSMHLYGRAADIQVKGFDPHEVYAWLDGANPMELGLGDADTFTHVDTRNLKARWKYK